MKTYRRGRRILLALPLIAALYAAFDGAFLKAGPPNYRFERIEFPGASRTYARSLNDSGQIVGEYSDFSGRMHGFVTGAGRFQTIDHPRAYNTHASAINASGQIVGWWESRPGGGEAYSFLHSGNKFTDIPDAPGSIPGTTVATALNKAGQVVGHFVDPCYCRSRMFLFHEGRFTVIDHPTIWSASAWGIDDVGTIVGVAETVWGGEGDIRSFLRVKGGAFTGIDVPSSSASTAALGINNLGQIVGYYGVRERRGFLFNGNSYTTIEAPDSVETSIMAINSHGQMIGQYHTANRIVHDFLATPNDSPLAKKLGTVTNIPN